MKNPLMLDADDNPFLANSSSVEDKLIIKNEVKKVEYIISLDKDIEEPHNYRAVFEILNMAKPEDIITFNINSYGGYVHTMIQFFYHMLNCKAQITGIVHTAYSAGAFIALCCDKIEVSKFGGMMLHSMSFGTWGKIEDVKGQTEFNSRQDKKIANLVFQGFLTKQEIQQLNKGTEFWLDKEDIDKRLQNWKSIKQRGL